MHGRDSAKSGMKYLADDTSKDVVLYINDYYPEYGAAFEKLAEKLGRPLVGIMLIDSTLKHQGQNLPDTSGLFKEVVCDFSDDAELRSTVKQFEDRLLLVSCSAESSQLDFQRVLPHVPYLPGPTEKSLEWATHKGKMRELIGAYNSELVPKVQAVSGAVEGEIKKVMRALTFPMMVKPTGLSDSSLVAKVHNEQELRQMLHNSFTHIHDIYKQTRGNGKPGVIVEEFMEGEQYTIDAYVDESGKVWTLPLLKTKSAHSVGMEGFYTYETETYHDLTNEEIRAGYRAATEAIHAIGLRASIAHMDMLKAADGWKIIEIGARPGAMRQEMYHVSYGIDHALNELLIKIGREPEVNDRLIIHSMVFKVYAEEKGVIKCVEGVEKVKSMPSLYTLQVFAKPGDKVRPTIHGGTVAVQGLLFGEQPERLRSDVAEARSQIMVKIHQHTPEHALVR
jgi:biotin carboxylase